LHENFQVRVRKPLNVYYPLALLVLTIHAVSLKAPGRFTTARSAEEIQVVERATTAYSSRPEVCNIGLYLQMRCIEDAKSKKTTTQPNPFPSP
jgi:hypothetical protein